MRLTLLRMDYIDTQCAIRVEKYTKGNINRKEKKGEINMKDSRYYFLLGFMSAMLFATVFVGCTAPLEAGGSSECGDSSWNPCYVKIVE